MKALMRVSDIILDGRLPEAIEQDIYAYVGCVSGALERKAYFDKVEAAGLGSIEVLKDVDYGKSIVEQGERLLEESGARPEDVIGKVRSVTFRAIKPR